MSQPPASGSMSRTPAAAPPSSSNIEGIFESALKSYKKKIKYDLKNHDLFKQFEKCDSPGDILAAFQSDQFGPSRIGDASKEWLVPTVNVLYALSATLGEGVGLAFPPAKVVFAGVGVLLLAAKDVAGSQDILIDILGRIGGFFSRLKIYTRIPLSPAMKNKMVEITVEVLDILATATKEMRQKVNNEWQAREWEHEYEMASKQGNASSLRPKRVEIARYLCDRFAPPGQSSTGQSSNLKLTVPESGLVREREFEVVVRDGYSVPSGV
ncbi:hypothetical protein EDB83DRAFT_2323416 [Lactarius deliciosus]|nr:hypothetical protein EDB83DRAFT_2323416 [Lactarius deliciosus]